MTITFETPAVSINLCCYNSEKFLEATLQSVFAQTFTDWELVIVNDGSTDGTDAIVKRHIAEGRRIVYHPQANAGLGAARNRALELSRGRYIALIDHDDVWLPRKLELQVQQMDGNARVGLSYTDADVIDAAGQRTGRYVPRHLMAEGDVLESLYLGDFIACSTVMMRREALNDVGVFKPELRITEEYDLFLRIAERYEIGLVAEPLLQLRVHASNASWNFLRTRAENRVVLMESLARRPAIKDRIGTAALRIRLAGFSCTPGEAAFLRHPLSTLRQRLLHHSGATLKECVRATLKGAVAIMPDALVKSLLRATAERRRRAATPVT